MSRLGAYAARAWRSFDESMPPWFWGALYAAAGAGAWLAAAVALVRVLDWVGTDSLFAVVMVQVLPFSAIVVAWVRLGTRLGTTSVRHFRALVWSPAWFILFATALAYLFFSERAREPGTTEIHAQLAAYAQVLPIFFIVFAIEWFRAHPGNEADEPRDTTYARTFVGVGSAVWIGFAELAALTALGEPDPSREWIALSAAAVVTGVVGATLLPALDLLERRTAERARAKPMS